MATSDTPDEQDLVSSPLHAIHEAAGAKFAPFAGWRMPLEYSGVRTEHTAVREGVGLFDVSHLGTLAVRHPRVAERLNTLFTNDLGRIGVGQAQYTLLCNDAGEVVDDLIAYWLADGEMWLVPNAANAAAVEAAVRALFEDAPDAVTDLHRQVAVIAVQGPQSADVMEAAGFATDLDYMQVQRAAGDAGDGASAPAGADIIVCRTGYTGEHGYELLVPAEQAEQVWQRLAAADTEPALCGLGARDTLRTEMGYPLHGQDLGGAIGPVEAMLAWAVGWDKPEFAGKEVLVERRGDELAPRLRGLVLLDRGVIRAGMKVHTRPDGPEIGTVTSGTFSPTLRTGVGLALLDRTIGPGDEVSVNVRGRWLAAEVTKPPMVPSHVRD